MKDEKSISAVIAQLEEMFRVLNDEFYNGELPTAAIRVQRSKRCRGWFTCNEIWQVGEERKHEIVIESNFLGENITDVVSVLLHEMTHLACSKGVGNNGIPIKDVSNGVYHNRKFKSMAESHGLKIDYVKTYGWNVTTPTPELIDCITKHGWKNFETFELDHNDGKRNSSTSKYICPTCLATCRATRDISLICGQCNQTMVRV